MYEGIISDSRHPRHLLDTWRDGVKVKLTKTVVDKAEPVAGRDAEYWDVELPRFGLRVKPSGLKTFFVRYTTKTGRKRLLTVGGYPAMTVAEARDKARRLLLEVGNGADPKEEQDAKRKAETVSELCREYLERHARPNKRPKSIREDERNIRATVIPMLGKIKVADVTRRDIEDVLFAIGKDHKPTANRVRSLLSKMFNLAIAWGMRGDNPVRGVSRFAEQGKASYLPPEQASRLLNAALEHPNERAGRAIGLLTTTGARKGEVLNATWDQFDLEKGIWTKPASTTKQKKMHRVPLNEHAITILDRMRQDATGDEKFLFPGNVPGQPITDIKKFWQGLCRSLGLEGIRIHDLRHTYASILISQGETLEMIGQLLGHSQLVTTSRYAHLTEVKTRESANSFSAALAKAAESSNIIPLRRA